MAVAADTIGAGAAYISVLSVSWVQDNTAGDFIRVGISDASAGYDRTNGATYDGAALASNGSVQGGSFSVAEFWEGVGIPTGTGLMVALDFGVVNHVGIANSFTCTGVDQADPSDAPVSNSGVGTGTGNLAVTSATGDLVSDAFSRDQSPGTVVVGAGQTTISNASSPADFGGGSSYEAGASSVNMSWTWDNFIGWCHIGANIRASGGGGGGTGYGLLLGRARNRTVLS